VKRTSSIDYAFANQAGVDVVDDITLNWEMAIEEGLDHVPIDVTLSDHAFRRYIDVLVPILPINIDELVILTQPRKQLLYSKIRDRYMVNVTKMQQTNDPNIAHEQWSIVAENFLRAWALLDDKDDDLDTAVNALTYMDADLAQRPTKKYTRRGQMRRIKAEPAVKDVSKGTINARDYVGAALNK